MGDGQNLSENHAEVFVLLFHKAKQESHMLVAHHVSKKEKQASHYNRLLNIILCNPNPIF